MTDSPTSKKKLSFQRVCLTDIVSALEGSARNTDTDPRWLAACELRKIAGWDSYANTIAIPERAAHEPEDVSVANWYAGSLLQSLVDKFGRPEGWKPLPDVLGKLTQIDNVIAGRLTPPPCTVPIEDLQACAESNMRLASAFKQVRADLALQSGVWSNAASYGLTPEDIGLKRAEGDSPTPTKCDG